MTEQSQLQAVATALRANRFGAEVIDKPDRVKERVLELVPPEAVVGIGDSVTVRQLGVIKALTDRGNTVFNPFRPDLLGTTVDPKEVQKRMRETFGRDVYVTGTNAVTVDGKLVNIDRAGNRVAGMIYGAPKVLLILGQNKIVSSVDDAIFRIKNVITPALMKRRGRNAPCAKTGKCADCSTIERACNIITIQEKKPLHTDTTVLLVAADLGLGWDPNWPETRIESARQNYYANSWAYTLKT